MKPLKAVEVGTYKDGGTSRALAEDGKIYFIDRRIASKKANKAGGVYNINPNIKGAKQLDIKLEVIPFRGNEKKWYEAKSKFLETSNLDFDRSEYVNTKERLKLIK